METRDPKEVLTDWYETIKRDNPDLLIEEYHRYLVQIYKFEQNDFDFCGTGFFCKFNEALYFVTCSHVAHECINDSCKPGVYVMYDDYMNNIIGVVSPDDVFESREGGGLTDNVDVFVCKIESKEEILKIEKQYNFFSSEDFDLGVPNIHISRNLCAFGFPYTRNKVEWRDSFFKYDIYTYSGMELEWNEYGLYKYELPNHIVFRCDWKGDKKPDPHGISGGCIFNISENKKILLAGMVFEMKERDCIIAGLNIQIVYDFLEHIDSNKQIDD